MKTKNNNKGKIYQDSKELPFLNYKRIVQSGNFFYMIKGYESGDIVNFEINDLKTKFQEIEEDYAMSINVKNSDVVTYGELAIATNEFNKFNIILLFIERVIKMQELRAHLKELVEQLLIHNTSKSIATRNKIILTLALAEKSEFSPDHIKDMLKDFKVKKSDDLYDQKRFIEEKLGKINNQIAKLNSSLEKIAKEGVEDYDIEEQFVSVCLGLDLPVDDTKITLLQYGYMVKALIKRVDELNKLKSHGK